MKRSWLAVLGLAVVLVACESDDDPFGAAPGLGPPPNLTARYEWLFEGWIGTQPAGDAAVLLSWEFPAGWDGEPFRVYAQRSGRADDFLIATVTSCAADRCLYTDANVRSGETYEYYVAAVDERRGREGDASIPARVEVPTYRAPPAPVPVSVTPFNNALLLRWEDGGLGDDLWKYQVWLVALNDSSDFYYRVGETDGTGFLDLRAQNGNQYTYRIAAVDFDGHVSRLSAEITGTPQPSAPAPPASASAARLLGGVYIADAARRPVSVGSAPWRLDIENGRYVLRPRELGQQREPQ